MSDKIFYPDARQSCEYDACPGCGEEMVMEDGEDETEQLVCENCGYRCDDED